MTLELLYGLLLPFAGTVLGAMLVFLMKTGLSRKTERALTGFAAGVMVAASVWSLLLPSIERAPLSEQLSFIPAAVGLLAGFALLLALDRYIPHLHPWNERAEGPRTSLDKTHMLVLSVTLHNIPEGMAVGVLMAARLAGDPAIGSSAVLSLALGIAIQNFPEGAIVSMPLQSGGTSRLRAFTLAILSAVAELGGALLALLMASLIRSLLPYFLAFAAGAMLFVVVEELIPDTVSDENPHVGTVLFALGFCLMMVLDVALG